MLIQFCFFGAYFLGSLIYFLISYYKGDPINRIGYKRGIIVGLFISASGCLLFYPAASLNIYALFLAALFILGLGFTLLQITANTYVSLLGSAAGASSRLNLSQGFNSLGTTIAPIIGGFLIFEKYAEAGHLSAEASKMPYLIFASIFLLAALVISQLRLTPIVATDTGSRKLRAWAFPKLRLGILAIFCYVGAEVTIGSFLINYLAQENVLNVPESIGKNYLAMYWGGAMIGRFLGAISLHTRWTVIKKAVLMLLTSAGVFMIILLIIDLTFQDVKTYLLFMALNLLGFLFGKSAPARMVFLFASICITFLLISMNSTGINAVWPLVSIGLFNSIMWSNIFTLSIEGLDKHTNQGSSLLIMAILGGALIPIIQGAVADNLGLEISFVVPTLCYLYILFYGLYCMRKK
jgi:FHS family L-fucose permease-like MFS transporter